MSYDRQFPRGGILRRDGTHRTLLLRGIEEVQEFLAMEGPESPDPLALGLLAQFNNCELLATEPFWKLGEGENLDQLMALHDVVLLDTTTLGELLQVHEGECRESCD
jgi:hypothetical protein